jgi:hypothetical protein
MTSVLVAHDSRGRLRFRIPAGAPTERLHASVAAAPGVTACTWSPRTRSLLVLYDPENGHRQAIAAAVTQASGLPPALDPDAPAATTEPGAAIALGVRQMFVQTDHGVKRATRGLVGLRGLLPVALTAWALAEIVRGRAAPLVWSSALWYAHGLFRDYQLPVTED